MEELNGRGEVETEKINLEVLSNKSRALVKVIFQGSSLCCVAFIDQWRAPFLISCSPPFFIHSGKGSVSRKGVVSPGKSCPRQWQEKLRCSASSGYCVYLLATSSQVKGKSCPGLLFQGAVCSPWQPLPGSQSSAAGCRVHGTQHWALLSLCLFLLWRDRGWFAALFKAKMPKGKFLVLSWFLYKAALWFFSACQTCQA